VLELGLHSGNTREREKERDREKKKKKKKKKKKRRRIDREGGVRVKFDRGTYDSVKL